MNIQKPELQSYPNPKSSNFYGHNHMVCWKSVFVGLVISLVAFIGLVGLGVAFGGIGLDQNSTMKGAGIFSGTWILVSSMIAMVLGSYAAVRNANFRIPTKGCAQAVTGAALFLIIFFTQASSLLGWLGNQAGSVAAGAAVAAGTGVSVAGQNSGVQDAVENLLGDVNLKNDPQGTISGITARLLRGDTESAKNYLARQAGITPAEADSKIAAAKIKIDELTVKARIAAAEAMKVAGWSVFLMTILSTLAAALGGWLGTMVNARRPLVEA